MTCLFTSDSSGIIALGSFVLHPAVLKLTNALTVLTLKPALYCLVGFPPCASTRWVFVHLSTTEYREPTPPLLRLGAGVDMSPGDAILLAVHSLLKAPMLAR